MKFYMPLIFSISFTPIILLFTLQDDPGMETASDSDDESDNSLDYTEDYSDIDVNVVLGKAVVIWSFSRPDSLILFTPRHDDSLFRLVKYAEQNLAFDHLNERITVMDPGERQPREMRSNFSLKPGSVIMIMPRGDINVVVEINQLKAKFAIKVDVMCTVYEVKLYLKRMKGIPIDQQDILYHDRAMENSRRLYEYRVKNNSIMHVLIQVHFDLLINIETFWGKIYRLYVDRCSTGSDLIYTIFGRCFSRFGPEHVSVHELYVPVHVLVLQHNNRSIHWEYCLGYFGIKNGDTLALTTVGRHSNLNMRPIRVISDTGVNYEITISQFDRWSVVAFIMHGLTNVPVDLIRLYKDTIELDFTSVIGNIPSHKAIMMNVTVTNVDTDMMFGVPLKIVLGHGIVENIKVSPTRTIKDLKTKLESMGVPIASLHELTISDYKLVSHARVKDIIYDLELPLTLKVERFPIFVHTPDGVIYKTMIDVGHCLDDFKRKIEKKSGHAMSSCRIMLAGQEYLYPDHTTLYQNGFSPKISVFIQTKDFFQTFYITKGSALIRMRIPARPTADDIKRSIWEYQEIPEGSMTCLQTFFFWFFHPRVSRKYLLNKKRKSRIRYPAADRTLIQMYEKPRKYGKMKELTRILNELQSKRKKYFRDFKSKVEVEKKHILQGGKNFENYKPVVRNRKEVDDSQTWPLGTKITDNAGDTNYRTRYKPKYRKTYGTQISPRQMLQADGYGQPEAKPHMYHVVHHPQPRWMEHLQQKDDANRLIASDEEGMAYRQKSKHDPFIVPRARRKTKKGPKVPVHYQGNADYYVKPYQSQSMYNTQDQFYDSPRVSVVQDGSEYSSDRSAVLQY